MNVTWDHIKDTAIKIILNGPPNILLIGPVDECISQFLFKSGFG